MWVSAVSITVRKPRTRRSIAVPFAVRAGIRPAEASSNTAPRISGMPSKPQWVNAASANATPPATISATTPSAYHVVRTLSGRSLNQPRFMASA